MFINVCVKSVAFESLRCKGCGHVKEMDIYMVGISLVRCDFCESCGECGKVEWCMEEMVGEIKFCSATCKDKFIERGEENECEYCNKPCGDRCFCNNDCYDKWMEQEGVSKCQNPECDNLTSWHFCSDRCLQACS